MKIVVVDVYNDGQQLSLFVDSPKLNKAVEKWRDIDRAFCRTQGDQPPTSENGLIGWKLDQRLAKNWQPFSEWMIAKGFVWLKHRRVSL